MSVRKALERCMEEMPIIDVHEHLPMSRAHRKTENDFFQEYSNYLPADLVQAGMPGENFFRMMSPEYSVMEKWAMAEPYWEQCRMIGSTRYIDLTVKEIYGIECVCRDTVEELNRLVRASMEKDWFEEILKKRCHIETALNHTPFSWVGIEKMEEPLWESDRRYFTHMADIVPFTGLFSINRLKSLETLCGREIRSLKTLTEACEAYLRRAAENGAAGFKTNIAYYRNLSFERAARDEASREFERVLAGNRAQEREGFRCTAPALDDYMMHFALGVMEELKLPLQVHTGMNGNSMVGSVLKEADPENLVPLFLQYPGLKFDLFHMGYPYQHVLGGLGHMFANVYIDLCWGHLVSPQATVDTLSELLEAIPYNKILGFGGDVGFLDGVAGHRRMAIEHMAMALAEKVESGLVSETKACQIARAILHDNGAELYGIGGENA